MVIVVYIS